MLEVLLPSIFFILLFLLLRRTVRLLSNTAHHSRHSLPVHRLSRPKSDDPDWSFDLTRWSVSANTTALNTLPRFWLARLGGKGTANLKGVYNFGSVVGVCGEVAGIGAAIWAVWKVWMTVWDEARIHAGQLANETGGVQKIVRRAIEASVTGSSETTTPRGGGLQPLIPGVTIPLSHLPTLLLSLIINQLIHELGHALSAALDDIAPSRLSFNLNILLPSMTVAFPSTIDCLASTAKMRIAASGPLHNLLTYLLLWSLAFSRMGRLFWRDDSHFGMVVETVDPASPLSHHVRPGDLLTHLDEIFLGGSDDSWYSYLSGSEVPDDRRGWCIDQVRFTGSSAAPCDAAGTIAFIPVGATATESLEGRCLPPHPILDAPSSSCDCPSSQPICVRPSFEEQVLRIRLETPRKDGENVLLWSGDRRAVLDQVRVGKQNPRLLGGVVWWGTMFLEYMSKMAFSLFVYNLLPLPYTDGSQLLRALLAYSSSKTDPSPTRRPMQATLSNHPRINIFREYELNSDDDEDYAEDGRERREEAWKRRVRRGAEVGVLAVCVVWAAGWGMLALLRSS